MNKVLIIDDEPKLLTLLERIISLEGFEVHKAVDIKSAFKKLENCSIDVILCDVKLPDGNGVDFCKTVKEKHSDVEIILMTAYGNIPDGVQAMKNGAFDYITKGDDNNRILPLINRAIEKSELTRKIRTLENKLSNKHSFDTIIGKSKVILRTIEMAKKVANTDTTVLLTGETGTGKEVFAQAIHSASKRNGHSFVALNCSALSSNLLESEMFGHKAGAFTGANKDKKGLFEEAHKGTIFLDELGEMPLELQSKLLRVLENGEFIKVGETKSTKVDVRVIAATNRDLKSEIEKGHFREDLFYRLSVFNIHIPSLNERTEDILDLMEHFMKVYSSKSNKKISGTTKAFQEAMLKHQWKGNIRELKNLIERAIIISDTDVLGIDALPYGFSQDFNEINDGTTLSAFHLASAEKLHIQKVLNYTKGNKTEAARLLNIALTTLYRKIDEYHLN